MKGKVPACLSLVLWHSAHKYSCAGMIIYLRDQSLLCTEDTTKIHCFLDFPISNFTVFLELCEEDGFEFCHYFLYREVELGDFWKVPSHSNFCVFVFTELKFASFDCVIF